MNKTITILFCALSIFCINTQAQTTIENSNFDTYTSVTDNDFATWFSNGIGLTQVTTNGITGGCLTTPDSVNWGNDEANYCSKYVGDLAAATNTSICFKYDTTMITYPSYQRGVSIWLKPYSDFNHYINVSFNHTRLDIITYSWCNAPGPAFMPVHGNWYQLVVATTFLTNDSVGIHAEVNDLGITGTSTPTLMAQSNGAIADAIFSNDTAIQIGVSGTKIGGALYLDDFHYSGHKSNDSCVIAVVNTINNPDALNNFVFSENNNQIQLTNSSEMKVEIINLEGKIVETQIVNRNFSFNTSPLASGIYFLNANSVDGNFEKQFAVIK